MPKPFNGEIGLDIRDSTPDWDAFLPDKAPEGSPNVLEGLCVGYDGGDAVSSEYKPRFEFTGGKIVKVVFDVADNTYVDIERHLAAAMARD